MVNNSVSGREKVAVSDSSYKLTTSSRRKTIVRRVPIRLQSQSAQRPAPKIARKVSKGLPKGVAARSHSQISVNQPAPRVARPEVQKRRQPLPTKPGQVKTPATDSVYPTQVRKVPIGTGADYPSNGKKTVRVRKQPSSKRVAASRKTRLKPMARNFLYGLRLLIIGVGMSAIVGTTLSVLDPANRVDSANSPNQVVQSPQSNLQNSQILLTQEIPTLKTAIQNLASANPNLTPGVFVLDIASGAYVDLNAGATFSAASTIKIPILIAFFQEVDAGNIRLDETMTMKQEFIAGGSGDMQYKPVGTKYTALEVANKMMTISDNTATNMLIDRLGGISSLNQRFQSWGLATTQIRNILPDLEGTNSTTPKELGQLLTMLNKGNLVSMISRNRILEIMRQTVRDTLLPVGVGQDSKIAHKTGDIRSMIGDAGLVDMSNGQQYAIAVMIQRPDNDPRAERLIGSISRTVYQHMSQLSHPTSPPTSPSTVNTGNTSIPNYNPHLTNPHLPIQNQPIAPSFNPTTYQSPVVSPPMTTPGYQMYQTPVAPQYYYPYQR